ncbi:MULTISPECIES: S66 peptidase family protein [Rhizobium]|uniref:S66 peptidase family protein n=1 Tax=Rhizobium TaxID=379 RepID=UPI00235F34BB|nr:MULTISPECIES: LD-carboxypeptidase [unclassified Rhizobium]MDC9810346.1 LD-carboxypeptidase [Rhizobium sp. MC62]WEA58965.1 LD-carboxypeptidase [Rhizobium sp. BJ04]
MLTEPPILVPPRLKAGDKIRFVSPASTPEKEAVLARAKVLESWGFHVDFGSHAFDKFGYLAGRDEDRLADLNEALRDPEVRAIFATRGGKGSFRISEQLDFDAVRRDPKPLVGFSDITALHLVLWKECRLVGVHGALMDDATWPSDTNSGGDCLFRLLTSGADYVLDARESEPTIATTTDGLARGRLIGGNLSMIATCAGWSLPNLAGAILLIEAVSIGIGQVDRELTMLRKAGHLDGVAGFAIGQFTGFDDARYPVLVDLLRDHLGRFEVPILGGLPLGHGDWPLSVPVGAMAILDARNRRLMVSQSALQ